MFGGGFETSVWGWYCAGFVAAVKAAKSTSCRPKEYSSPSLETYPSTSLCVREGDCFSLLDKCVLGPRSPAGTSFFKFARSTSISEGRPIEAWRLAYARTRSFSTWGRRYVTSGAPPREPASKMSYATLICSHAGPARTLRGQTMTRDERDTAAENVWYITCLRSVQSVMALENERTRLTTSEDKVRGRWRSTIWRVQGYRGPLPR